MKRIGKVLTERFKISPVLTAVFTASAIILVSLASLIIAQEACEKDVLAAETGESGIFEELETVMEERAAMSEGENLAGADEGESAILENTEAVPSYTINAYEAGKTLYANDLVNVRSGAGTEFDKYGTIRRGSEVTVIGETDNGWYQVLYNDAAAYIKAEYLQETAPGVAFIFAGDSRTVQMSKAVKNSSYVWIAKVGEGYNYFESTAVPQIDANVGAGSVIIINYGVNDLHNVNKYINLVNSKVGAWTDAGATVYYAAVDPVSNYPTITNADIENFNNTLKAGLDSRVGWLDGYSFLANNGFNTNDGLHYDNDTYRNLYSYYMSRFTA